MKRSSALLIVATVLATASAGADDPEKHEAGVRADETAARASAISDRDLSLYPGSVFELPNPLGFESNAVDPGDNALLPRPFPIAPPRVPHGVG